MANVVNILKIVRQINTDAGVVAKNMKKAKVVAAKTGQIHRPKAVKPKKGLTLDQLILATPNRVASYSKRDRVTLVSLKVSKDKNRIVSKTLTYDITKSGPPQVRPHKHWFEKREDVPFYKAKKVKFNCDCLTGDTKVLTVDGWKTIYELAEDFVPDHYPVDYVVNGKIYKGSFPYYKGKSSVWKVTLSNGLELKATKDHRILTAAVKYKSVKKHGVFIETKRTYTKSWKRVQDLNIGDKIVLTNNKQIKIEFCKDFYEAFFVGVMMGDGSLFNTGYPDLQLYKDDREEIIDILVKAGVVNNVVPIPTKNGLRVSFNARAMELLRRYKFINKQSVEINSAEKLMGYLSGLIVTDGSVTGGAIKISGDAQYLTQLRDLLIQYGYSLVSFAVERPKGTKTNYGVASKDMCSLRLLRPTLRSLETNLLLTQQKHKTLSLITSKEPKIKECVSTVACIKFAGRNLDVYDITVPKIKRFVANGMIVHNCEFYKFHCEYANNHHDAADIRFCNGEYPIITNPRLQPRMCKHGFILLKYLKKNRM